MQRIYFTRAEAQQQVDRQVEALMDFPSVPKGSNGVADRAIATYVGNRTIPAQCTESPQY